MFEDNDPKFATLCLEESKSSGSEYKAPVGSDESESESESDTELDEGPELEGNEPDTNIQLKAGKKQKKGQIARDQIGAAAAINEEPSPFADSKRPTASKSGQTPGPASKGTSTSHPLSGLAPQWQKLKCIEAPALTSGNIQVSGQCITSENDSDSGINSRHHSLSRGSSGHLGQPSSGVTSREPESDVVSYGYGGFVPNDEGLERRDVMGDEQKSALKFKSITKIREIHLTPSPRNDLLTTNKSHKKKEIMYENLPLGTKNRFKKSVIPLALDTAGALKPWNTPSLILGPITQLSLASRLNVQYRAGFTNNLSDKRRPFIWESVYDDLSARQEIINAIDAENHVREKPVGALIYSIQAVHRALLYSVTGTLKLPMDKKSAEFSKTNWGDHMLVTPHCEKVVKRASVFLNKISTLKDQQWDDIFKRALALHSSNGKQQATAKDLEVEMKELSGEVDSKSDDNDLVDPRQLVVSNNCLRLHLAVWHCGTLTPKPWPINTHMALWHFDTHVALWPINALPTMLQT
ncbi:hypothetical protein EDB84DRAFT_1441670 [Lactarius hengduanensis]|nr:hypothetical protein EDB84DRAFT_1441670 [Lactarius hengduanensis]